MSFEALKTRLKAMGKPKTPEGCGQLLDSFTPAEEQIFYLSQRMIAEGVLFDNKIQGLSDALDLVMSRLNYSQQDAADFIRLGLELLDKSPPRPDILAKMAAYFDADGNPYISQTRH